LKCEDLTVGLQLISNLKIIDCGNSRVNWNRLKNIQKIPEQRTWKARHRGIMYSSLTGHCTVVWECSNVIVGNMGNNIRFTKCCNYSVAAKLRLHFEK
jgi:hypothetical protein